MPFIIQPDFVAACFFFWFATDSATEAKLHRVLRLIIYALIALQAGSCAIALALGIRP